MEKRFKYAGIGDACNILFDMLQILQRIENKISVPNIDDLITKEELAKALDVSKKTIENYTKEGILTPYRIGGLIRYSRSGVLNSLQEKEEK